MERLTVGPLPTEVLVDRTLPPRLLPERADRSRVAIVTQPGATEIALKLAADLEAGGLATEVIGVPDKEEAKTLDVVASIYEILNKFGLTRRDTVMGVGGGTVTDVAGFAAGTWMRGVESVLVPTTVLAAVDAAIGGKTGVNVSGKNLVGVFWHPSRVVVDTGQLETLPSFLIRDGLAEVYKAGLVGDPALADDIEQNGLPAELNSHVIRAIAVKAKVVDEDANETSVRAHLNYGHTIGHALEYASTLSHGEAVGLGMICAARLSAHHLGFDHEAAVRDTLDSLSLPTGVTGLNRTRVVDLVGRDKKRDSTGLRMILLEDVGRPVIRPVTQEDVDLALDAIGL